MHEFIGAAPISFAKSVGLSSPRLALVVGLFGLAFASFANAQNGLLDTGKGEISGSVLLSGNHPAPQVVVTLKSRLLGVSRSVLTDLDGRFDLQGLPTGAYEVTAEESGFDPAISSVRVESNLSNIVLRLKQTVPSRALHTSPTVSVRQLKIPEKARDEYQHGLQSLAKNNLPDALKHFNKASAADSDFYEAEYHIGLTQLRMGHNNEAMKSFQKAIDQSDGHYAPAEFGVGALLYESGNTDEAKKAVCRGLELDDTLAEGHALLGMVFIREKLALEAERAAREALLRKPSFAQAYLILADAHASRKEYRSQLQDLETFLKLAPEGPERTRAIQAREIVLRNISKSEATNNLLVASSAN